MLSDVSIEFTIKASVPSGPILLPASNLLFSFTSLVLLLRAEIELFKCLICFEGFCDYSCTFWPNSNACASKVKCRNSFVGLEKFRDNHGPFVSDDVVYVSYKKYRASLFYFPLRSRFFEPLFNFTPTFFIEKQDNSSSMLSLIRLSVPQF